jgi:hypothetical protein
MLGAVASDLPLRIAYAANLMILVPVCAAMLSGPGGAAGVFEHRVAQAEGMRILVGALWLGIAVASAAGLVWPRPFAGILVLQIVYKATFLVLFAFPLWRAEGASAVPWGVTGSFIVIVLVWPWLLAAAR